MAQDYKFEYDNAGNRTKRKYIDLGDPTPPEIIEKDNVNGNAKETKEKVYEDLVAEKQIKIYPNPTYGLLTLEIVNYNAIDKGSIQVFDLSGRLVYTVNQLSSSMEINLTSEPAGTYIMIIVIGNEKSEWKIAKQ